MTQAPKTAIELKDFQGMSSVFDPNDISPGVSRLQVNVTGQNRGQLDVRGGLWLIEFDDE